MADLPPRQAAVLEFIRDYQASEGRSPTIYEIAEHFRFTPANAAKLLSKLAARGELSRQLGSRRSIRLTSPVPAKSMQVPLIGRIAAGAPVTSGAHVADYIDVSPKLFDPPADMLFRVSGESMINAGIHDGDLVGIHLQDSVQNGQIVAAVITHTKTDDPELTLKTLRRSGGMISLLSENDDQQRFAPMTFMSGRDAIQLIGVYCGLVRARALIQR